MQRSEHMALAVAQTHCLGSCSRGSSHTEQRSKDFGIVTEIKKGTKHFNLENVLQQRALFPFSTLHFMCHVWKDPARVPYMYSNLISSNLIGCYKKYVDSL